MKTAPSGESTISLDSLEPMLDLIYPNRLHDLVAVVLPLALAQIHVGELLAAVHCLGYPSLSRREVGGLDAPAVEHDDRLELSLVVRGEGPDRVLDYRHGVLAGTELALTHEVIDPAAPLHRCRLVQGDVVPLVRCLAAIAASELETPPELGS